jgi:hypothetical protein
MQKSKVVFIDCVSLWLTHLGPISTTRLLSLYNSLNRLLSLYNSTCDLHGLYLMIFIYLNSYLDPTQTLTRLDVLPQLSF